MDWLRLFTRKGPHISLLLLGLSFIFFIFPLKALIFIYRMKAFDTLDTHLLKIQNLKKTCV